MSLMIAKQFQGNIEIFSEKRETLFISYLGPDHFKPIVNALSKN